MDPMGYLVFGYVGRMIYFYKKIPFLLFSKGPFDKLLSIEIKKTCLEVLRLLTWWFMGSFLTLILPPHLHPQMFHPADASSESLEVFPPQNSMKNCVEKRTATSRH